MEFGGLAVTDELSLEPLWVDSGAQDGWLAFSTYQSQSSIFRIFATAQFSNLTMSHELPIISFPMRPKPDPSPSIPVFAFSLFPPKQYLSASLKFKPS